MKRIHVARMMIMVVAAGCFDATNDLVTHPEEATTSEASSALLGELCPTRACQVNECGMVPDGCRSEMWCGNCECSADQRSCDRAVTRVFETLLSASGGTVRLVTGNLSPGADPVLHVLDSGGGEIAFDDDSAGGGNATVTVFASPFERPPRVVIRAKSADTA